MVTAPAAWASATVAYGGGPLRPGLSSTNRLAKSTLPMASPMGGMMTSSTNDLTMVPNAPPMMMPTAKSSTLPRSAKALNSLSIGESRDEVATGYIDESPLSRALEGPAARLPLGEAAGKLTHLAEAAGSKQARRDC